MDSARETATLVCSDCVDEREANPVPAYELLSSLLERDIERGRPASAGEDGEESGEGSEGGAKYGDEPASVFLRSESGLFACRNGCDCEACML